jgi:hypothetical protein
MFGQNGLEALFIDEIVETCIAFVEDAEKPFTISDGVKKVGRTQLTRLVLDPLVTKIV